MCRFCFRDTDLNSPFLRTLESCSDGEPPQGLRQTYEDHTDEERSEYIVYSNPQKNREIYEFRWHIVFLFALKVYTHTFKVFKGLEGLEGFKGLRAGKRQAWTPIRSH